MTFDQPAAQASIDALLDMPRLLAGSPVAALDAALSHLSRLVPTEAEFGPLLTDAAMALQTVNSALLALRHAAVDREKP